VKQFVLKKINELRGQLDKIGLSSESSLLFLLCKFAGYDDEWRNTVEELAKENPRPFDEWFGDKNKIYIPFIEEGVKPDRVVDMALKNLGFNITDYIKGYAEKDGKVLKIGKILAKKQKEVVKKFDAAIAALDSTGPDYEHYKREQEEHKKAEIEYWISVANMFRDSKIRSDKSSRGRMVIVISQDPHDLAQMSYERSWTSCMRLGEGMYYQDLLCEVSGGGMVAYLIDKDDTEIKNPIARLHIRRFDSPAGRIVAMPEKNVYGNTDIKGFREAVKGWVDSMNEHVPAGVYRRKGGRYSDSYQNVYVNLPETSEEKIQWLKENRPELEESIISFRDKQYENLKSRGYWKGFNYWNTDEDGDKVFSNDKELNRFQELLKRFDPEDKWIDIVIGDKSLATANPEKYKDERERLKQERFTINRRTEDHTSSARKKIIDDIIEEDRDKKEESGSYKYDESVHKEVHKTLEATGRGSWNYDKRRFYYTYPHFMTMEVFNTYTVRDKIDISDSEWLPEELRKSFKADIRRNFVEKTNINSPYFKAPEEVRGDSYELSSFYKRKFIDVLRKLEPIINNEEDVELIKSVSDLILGNIHLITEKEGYNKEYIVLEYTRAMGRLKAKQERNKRYEDKAIVGLDDALANEYIKIAKMPQYSRTYWPEDTGLSIHTIGRQLASAGKKAKEVLPLLKDQLMTIETDLRKPRSRWMGSETHSERDDAIKTTRERIEYVIKAIEEDKLPENDWPGTPLRFTGW
jgi:hypothetical protein